MLEIVVGVNNVPNISMGLSPRSLMLSFDRGVLPRMLVRLTPTL